MKRHYKGEIRDCQELNWNSANIKRKGKRDGEIQVTNNFLIKVKYQKKTHTSSKSTYFFRIRTIFQVSWLNLSH